MLLDTSDLLPCPLQVVHVGGGSTMPVTLVLHRILQRSFPEVWLCACVCV